MKKHYVILMLMVSSLTIGHTQSTTHYGFGTGIAGVRGSYFGEYAGAALLVDHILDYRNTDNSFFGSSSGRNTTGGSNTGVGSTTLFMNTTGSENIAVGFRSMEFNVSGNSNVAVGAASLNFNTIGNDNTAVGTNSLRTNVSGNSNTAIGTGALGSNLANLNTAAGHHALNANTDGTLNVAFGAFALRHNTGGILNSAFGYNAGPTSGSPALVNTTALGANAVPSASNQVRIGNNNVTSIGGRVAWSVLSDGRFKTNVKEDVAGLEFITRLRAVSYYIDNGAINRFMGIADAGTADMSSARKADREQGFIAQEVETLVKKSGYVFSGVQAPQNEKDHYSIRYSDFVVPLVKAVQELASLVKEQQEAAQVQQNEIAALKTQLALGSNSASSQFQSTIGASLSQNSPNPFNVDTNINMSIPETARGAVLTIYSMEGKQVKSMPINDRGDTSVKIHANELAPGIYIYSLMADGKVLDSKRMILTGN